MEGQLAGELTAAIAAFPGPEALLIEYVDLRGAGERVRKYRVMAVDGVLHPLHVAVARAWKVHYFTADMAADAANRAGAWRTRRRTPRSRRWKRRPRTAPA